MCKKLSEFEFRQWKAERRKKKEADELEQAKQSEKHRAEEERKKRLELSIVKGSELLNRRREESQAHDKEAERLHAKMLSLEKERKSKEAETERQRLELIEKEAQQKSRVIMEKEAAKMQEAKDQELEDSIRAETKQREQRLAQKDAEMRALAIDIARGNATYIEVKGLSFVVPNKTELSIRPSSKRQWTLDEAKAVGEEFDKAYLLKNDVKMATPTQSGKNVPIPKTWKPQSNSQKTTEGGSAIENVFAVIQSTEAHIDGIRSRAKPRAN